MAKGDSTLMECGSPACRQKLVCRVQDNGDEEAPVCRITDSDVPLVNEEVAEVSLTRKLVAEGVGTMLLVATVVGSGIMGDALAEGNAAVALLGNTIATWGILYVLINVFGDISSHFNPIVTAALAIRQEFNVADIPAFFAVQTVGGILGTMLAHAMFESGNAAMFDGKDRTSGGEFLGEIVSTFVLLITIFGVKKRDLPMAVGLAILAGYWYTSSTSFANPAVTIARTFTNTFASIKPASVPVFIAGQLAGLCLALPFIHAIIEGKPLRAPTEV